MALALTHNPQRASALAKETLSWAWQHNEEAGNADTIKMALLKEMRGRYMRQDRVAPGHPASCEQQFQEAGI